MHYYYLIFQLLLLWLLLLLLLLISLLLLLLLLFRFNKKIAIKYLMKRKKILFPNSCALIWFRWTLSERRHVPYLNILYENTTIINFNANLSYKNNLVKTWLFSFIEMKINYELLHYKKKHATLQDQILYCIAPNFFNKTN